MAEKHKLATELLKAQHKEVKALFKRFEKSKSPSEKTTLFDELAACLVAHDAIEREIFYPACEEAMGLTKLLDEAIVEHGLVEFSLYVADEAREGEDFDTKVHVLSEVVEHHVKEEEEEFFPKVEKAMDEAALGALAVTMKARFEEVKAADFREPLHHNLELVLAGATKAGADSGPKARKVPAKKHDKAPAKAARAAN